MASSPSTEFAIGQIVGLRADPSVTGAVIQVLPGQPEDRYVLFHDGKTATYYASQLQPQAAPETRREVLSLEEFGARLTSLQIKQPSLSNLYSLHAARVNFVPYQFRPVLRFIRSERPRLLIADEVGVGKTIEAGLILRELQARRDIRSVLIICPRPLVMEKKWAWEMKRFDEEFTDLDGATLRGCIKETDLDGVWPPKHARIILSFSRFDERLLIGVEGRGSKKEPGLLRLDPKPRFDLVIVDEAHHLRNPLTNLHKGVRFFCDNADAVLFLTATPIQLQSEDLFVLLNLLRPDLILDRQSFIHMAEPNPFINRAVELARGALPDWQAEARNALSEAGATAWGQALLQNDSEFQRLCALLTKKSLSSEERLAFIRETEDLRTFSRLINRTRRRDIGNFTTRKAETVEVEFTPPQQALHDSLLATQARILRRAHGDRSVQFMMTTLRRQAASCLYGLAPLIRDILMRRMDELLWEEADDAYEEFDEGGITTIAEDIQEVLEQAECLDTHDPKLDALIRVVRDKQKMPNNKLLLFSSFRHTLAYLVKHLAGMGLRIGLIHGGIPDNERVDLRERFRHPREEPDAIDMLLSSEVGCEGLDYEFCDCLVNYDLPWNPMRVEQRIGRIDRYGQRSETVAIYNFVTPGTVDFDIYHRCHMRIGLFRQALGGSEEILGRITRELRAVAENLELTEEERCARLQQIEDNEIRQIQEQDLLEQQQEELFGITLPPQQIEQEVADASSAWLTPAALQNMIARYLAAVCGGSGHILGEKPLKTLRLSEEARNRLLEDFRKLTRQASALYREWERWLKGNVPLLEITFDAACAADRRSAVFIMPIHPLALQAASATTGSVPCHTACRVRDEAVPPGAYLFAVYQWQKRGVRDDTILQPVCSDDILTDRFLNLLAHAEPIQTPLPDQAVFDELEEQHYRLWSRAQAEHQAQTRRTAQFRRESLRVSHQARMTLLREQYARVDEAKIRRMRDSQIGSAESDFSRRMQEIEAAENRADIVSQPIAYGVMVVEEGR